MICYDKYGKMTPEFQQYQQMAWEQLRTLAEEITAKAIQDRVCPKAIQDTMKTAIDCGCILASQQAYVDDNIKRRQADNKLAQQLIDYA